MKQEKVTHNHYRAAQKDAAAIRLLPQNISFNSLNLQAPITLTFITAGKF